MTEYPHQPGTKSDDDTTKLAADYMRGKSITLCRLVKSLLDKESLTADECAARLSQPVLTIRPRLSELRKQGTIEDSGHRRKNASGVSAIVWRIKPKGA